MGFGVSFIVLIFVWLQRHRAQPPADRVGQSARLPARRRARDDPLRERDGLRVGLGARSCCGIHRIRTRSTTSTIVVYRQYSMYEYHDNLVATHPYSSKWWEWPLDYVPIAYFYQDHRKDQAIPSGCCVYEITSMPNPVILWFGLFTVPWVGVAGVARAQQSLRADRLTYLLQWLPWIMSPRITFAYHFYVDIPLICLCNAIVLQRVWRWAQRTEGMRSGSGAWRSAPTWPPPRRASSFSIRSWRRTRFRGMPGTSGCGSQPGSSAPASEGTPRIACPDIPSGTTSS